MKLIELANIIKHSELTTIEHFPEEFYTEYTITNPIIHISLKTSQTKQHVISFTIYLKKEKQYWASYDHSIDSIYELYCNLHLPASIKEIFLHMANC